MPAFRFILAGRFSDLARAAPAMLRFAANLSFLFTELPFPERFAAAAKAGFRGVEYLFPYAWPAADLAGWLAEAGLEQVLFNLPAGDWEAGERGLACHPGRTAEFRAGLAAGLDYAARLGCRRLHLMAGIRPAGVPEAEIAATFLAHLRTAAEAAAQLGITVLIEPINSRIDMPGYWLDTPAKALALIRQAGCANLALQLDLYHARVMDCRLADLLQAHLPEIGHLQLADFPGRHEPGSGDIDYPALFALLERLGYAGWIGCEYRPRTDTPTSLAWLPRALDGARRARHG